MTFTEQEFYIDSLNSGNLNSDYHLISLNENVDFGYFWAGPKAGKYPGFRWNYLPNRYYLVKSDGKYCSIVHDAGIKDLQVFTKHVYRRNQHLFNALTNTIFGHLKNSREHQEVTTTQDNRNAQLLLEKIGFQLYETVGNKLYYRLDLSNFIEVKPINNLMGSSTLDNYKITISRCFEAIEVIEKHLKLNGNYETLRENIEAVNRKKNIILSDFNYDINQINES